MPPYNVAGPSISQIFWNRLRRRKPYDERKFYRVNHSITPLLWPKNVCDRNADAQSLCGSSPMANYAVTSRSPVGLVVVDADCSSVISVCMCELCFIIFCFLIVCVCVCCYHSMVNKDVYIDVSR